tara:strand:+ start:2806 stop:3396 length:591 start_codon:yes stop_codon:yes gene_type:complete
MTSSLNQSSKRPNLEEIPSINKTSNKVSSNLRLITPLGQIHIHQSPFRGSFSVVLTEAVRAAGLGRKVLLAQFLRGGVCQGINNPTMLCDNLIWVRPDIESCIDPSKEESIINNSDSSEIKKIWYFCKERIIEGSYDQIILDEVSLAINLGIIQKNDLISTLEKRRGSIDVILTGPPMPEEILSMADQITELRSFK